MKEEKIYKDNCLNSDKTGALTMETRKIKNSANVLGEKNIDEVAEEIESALKDPKGLLFHQKRLGFCLSEGIKEIIENYLKNEEVLKTGFKIDHRIFKKNKENVKKILSDKITCSIDDLKEIDGLIESAYKIESKRNDLVYGSPVSEKILKELIDLYLSVKKEVEKNA
jgi:hypothetical protein